jgi:hypothetical protein
MRDAAGGGGVALLSHPGRQTYVIACKVIACKWWCLAAELRRISYGYAQVPFEWAWNED